MPLFMDVMEYGFHGCWVVNKKKGIGFTACTKHRKTHYVYILHAYY